MDNAYNEFPFFVLNDKELEDLIRERIDRDYYETLFFRSTELFDKCSDETIPDKRNC